VEIRLRIKHPGSSNCLEKTGNFEPGTKTTDPQEEAMNKQP